MSSERKAKRATWAIGISLLILILTGLLSYLRPHFRRIENISVRNYYHSTIYQPNMTSVINDYLSENSNRADKPRAYKVSFTPVESELELILKAENRDYEIRKTIDGTTGSCQIKNLYPNTLYSFSIQSVDGISVIKRGWFYMVGTVRMLDVAGIYNVRDIGGLHTSGGKRIRYGKIIRGSELDGEHEISIQEEGVKTLVEEVRIGYDLDLRKDDEVDMDQAEKTPPISSSNLGRAVKYTRVPIDAYIKPWTEPGDIAETSEAKNHYYDAFRIIFDCVEMDIPVYVHCWGGADRTGTICFLIEGLLGVEESELAKDYELTSFARKFGVRTINSEDYQNMYHYILAKGNGDQLSMNQFKQFFLELGFTEQEILSFQEKMLG